MARAPRPPQIRPTRNYDQPAGGPDGPSGLGGMPPIGPGGPPPGGPDGPFGSAQHAENVGSTLRRVWRYFMAEKLLTFGIFAVVTLGVICGLVAPNLQAQVIDIIAGTNAGDFVWALGGMAAAYFAYALCQLGESWVSAHLSQRIVSRMRVELFGKVVDLPVGYIDRHSHGDLMSRMTNDIESISNTVSRALPSLFSSAFTIVGTALVMIVTCWQLAVVSFASIALTLVASRFIAGKMRQFSRERQRLLGEVNGTVEETLSSVRTVVSNNYQRRAVASFRDSSDALTRAGIRAEAYGGTMGPVMNCINNLGFVLVAAVGGWLALQGITTIGVISAFVVYIKQFGRPVSEIAMIYGQLQTAVACAERVFVILDERGERDGEDASAKVDAGAGAGRGASDGAAADASADAGVVGTGVAAGAGGKAGAGMAAGAGRGASAGAGPSVKADALDNAGVVVAAGAGTGASDGAAADASAGAGPSAGAGTGAADAASIISAVDSSVEFQHVDFSYVPGVPVLQDFCLKVPAGQKVALVGATGSGKTTVVNLLERFYDVDRGCILLGGRDIASVEKSQLRRQMSIVLQSSTLFTGTVSANVRYGREDATDEQVAQALHMSHCEEWVASLPQGLDTVLEGGGGSLSHGQRQLLAIARAFVADPDVLILDEATSSVDTRTEKAVQGAMQEIMRNRTSIVIAHRLSTIRDADLIVVMNEGRIVESGTHQQLLDAGGVYSRLYQAQFAGFSI